MTAWGMVAVCGAGGVLAGPLLDTLTRRVRPRRVRAAADVAAVGVGVGETAPVTAPVGAAACAAPQTASVPPAEVRSPVGETAAIALVTGVLWALAALRVGDAPSLAAYCALFGALVAVSLTDLRTGLVPRALLYPAVAVVGIGLVAASAQDHAWRPLLDALIGGAAAFGLFGAIWWVYPRGMGFGDVRLAGLCGGALGWLGFRQLYLGFLIAFVAGAVIGLAVLLVRRSRKFPFAPALAVGTMVGVLWGGWLGTLWLHPG